ncbi:ATP-binding cassette domain-containing protein [Acidiphilium sp. PM]|uniref:ATP-binding cassette domain-containing protein n=1 Tax=Acidiphilium sp. PM TaxID=1043206 RepID=UPI00021445FC|nr:ATP-binding cassette domain-containing protein [Acidiphilium sp. PM]EGO93640.1 ABC transporter related protein [Acidiphilium sp. PM]
MEITTLAIGYEQKTDAQNCAAAAKTASIRLSGISKSFSGVSALSDVTVEFQAGEVHAVLGENGAGKSTLMNVIAGVLQPDAGVIEIGDRHIPHMSPEVAKSLGISICYQHPSILDDLSVLENLRVGLPGDFFGGRPVRDVARAILDNVGLRVPLHTRCELLTVAQRHLLEIAKALATNPRVLILDEPTASLDQESTDMLFRRVREVVALGTSVIYITHRLAELRQIAHRVTVLRDGRVRGGALVDQVDDASLLNLIVGRTLTSTFPTKNRSASAEVQLSVRSLTSDRFRDVSFDASRGEIIGIAGVEGNGQSELMRALAGLLPWTGTIDLKGRSVSYRDLLHEAAFMPSDRHAEGLAGGLSVRENAALAALPAFASFGIMNRKRELEKIEESFASLAVKAPSIDAPVFSLSGGNQQKVVMARALLSAPGLIIADEPTQGVDVGARAEIYRILREATDAGIPVIVNSSDAAELEGLCDTVVVLSRGRVVETLTGEDVVEARIVGAAVGAGSHFVQQGGSRPGRAGHNAWRHFVQTDNAPTIPLAIVIVAMALLGYSNNSHYLSAFNVSNILTLATALGFIAIGQTIAMLLGAIDLSVGPLAGFLVVVASFFVNSNQTAAIIGGGFLLMLVGAVTIGTINGCLIRYANFTPIAATLAMYIGLQGCSYLLRSSPGGYINANVVAWITYQIGPLPLAFLIMVGCAFAGEYVLRRRRAGWALRATGSDEESARRIGLRIDLIYLLGYVGCAIFTSFGAVMLMAQIGVGDPSQGANYTLSSITAVVLGGTSLRGGRGTFVGSMLGALLLTEVLNVVSFLGLSQTYQYVFQGTLILAAAVIYVTARGRGGASILEWKAR